MLLRLSVGILGSLAAELDYSADAVGCSAGIVDSSGEDNPFLWMHLDRVAVGQSCVVRSC